MGFQFEAKDADFKKGFNDLVTAIMEGDFEDAEDIEEIQEAIYKEFQRLQELPGVEG